MSLDFIILSCHLERNRRALILLSSERNLRLCRRTLVALPLVRAHVAADAVVFLVRARFAPLIGLQQMTSSISAAVRIARVNRRASLEQRDGLCGAAVVAQLAEFGDGVVQIARATEIAGFVAA